MPLINGVAHLVISCGEPAGIGPDICLDLGQYAWPCKITLIGDLSLLKRRADDLGLNITLQEGLATKVNAKGVLNVLDVPTKVPVKTGILDPKNAQHVLDILKTATRLCLEKKVDALVTAPVHKAVINDANVSFSGHTEFLAEMCQVPQPVMLLATDTLRVALATTHLALRDVADAITQTRLQSVLRILEKDLKQRFAIPKPCIAVTGLNPHAGEGGHLGREEIDIIEPALDELRGQGMRLLGPVPADTLFLPVNLEPVDAVLAMYHDQGLPVLKALGFGNAVNVTLGLPIIRTSVDHGTALDLAGTGNANSDSLVSAVKLAKHLAESENRRATQTS